MLSDALATSMHRGMRPAIKKMLAAWPDTARWERGASFLQEEIRAGQEEDGEWSPGDPLPDVPVREVLGLLYTRTWRTSHRMFRADQVRDFYAEPRLRSSHPWIEINRRVEPDQDFCGRGTKVLVPVEAGLWLMGVENCDHPACQCTFDPSRGQTDKESA